MMMMMMMMLFFIALVKLKYYHSCDDSCAYFLWSPSFALAVPCHPRKRFHGLPLPCSTGCLNCVRNCSHKRTSRYKKRIGQLFKHFGAAWEGFSCHLLELQQKQRRKWW